VRRLRAALRLLRLRDLDGPVKKLQDALGKVRDLQLQVEWLAGRDDALAARRKALLDRAKRALARAVAVWRSQTLPRLLEAGGGEFKGKFADKKVRKLLRKRLARFEERLERALKRPTPQAMHAVRRSVKQLRYLFELVQPALRSVSKSLLAELTPLQEALGELHDMDVRIQLLRDKALLREQHKEHARLAGIVTGKLSRWKKQKIAPRARRTLA
jgi:CHAD domain-containing protein